MSYKKEVLRILARMQYLNEFPDHTQEEMDEIGRNIPIKVLKDANLLARYASDNNFSLSDSFIIAAWLDAISDFLADIKVNNDISYSDACKYYDMVRTRTIIVHRVNYILHETIISIFDILERDKRMRFAVKQAAGRVESVWKEYLNNHRKTIESTAWYTMQDHLRLVSDAVSPLIEKVYETLRDYTIGKGMRDVEVKARCIVVLLMGKVVTHTFRRLFDDFEKECGVDYSRCFIQNDMTTLMKNFAVLCDTLGIKTKQDSFGCYEMADFNPENSVRFKWAWGDFINTLRDDNLMDDNARRAIELNPVAREEYHHILEEEERKQVEAGLEKLTDKFNKKK